jgi:hypothetical protein
MVNAVSKTPPHGIMDTRAFTGATAITVAEHERPATACKRFARLRFVHESDHRVSRELLSYSIAKSSRLVSVAGEPFRLLQISLQHRASVAAALSPTEKSARFPGPRRADAFTAK